VEDRIIFVPQGDLFQVSFPALKDKEGKYLIEKHTIQTATSIQLLKLTHNLRKLQRKSAETRSLYEPLVVGNPAMPYIPRPTATSGVPLANLPGAEQEALAIADLLDVPALTGKAATESAITHRLKTASLAHFATHGLLDYGNPEVSGIRDIPGAIVLATDYGMGSPEGDGLLTAGEIMNLSLPAELVVLSACNTGRGDITADGVVGLSRALIAAGVPSIIVSLWAVPDAPTSQLMTAFYRNIEHTGNKAQALRQAMLSTLETYPDPADWAAFTLIGEAF
jgi:CHAT domain-containing protein